MNKHEYCEQCIIDRDKEKCSCPCHQEHKASWEERFDNLEVTYYIQGNNSYITEPLLLNIEQESTIKTFIQKELSSTKQQIVNEIVEEGDGLKKKTQNYEDKSEQLWGNGYNQAIQDYQNLIKSKYE